MFERQLYTSTLLSIYIDPHKPKRLECQTVGQSSQRTEVMLQNNLRKPKFQYK